MCIRFIANLLDNPTAASECGNHGGRLVTADTTDKRAALNAFMQRNFNGGFVMRLIKTENRVFMMPTVTSLVVLVAVVMTTFGVTMMVALSLQ